MMARYALGRNRWTLSAALFLFLLPASLLRAAETPKAEPEKHTEGAKVANSVQVESDKKALAPFQLYVGSWKGSGALKGGNAKEAWGEDAEWRWDFKDGRATLCCASPTGKYYSAIKLEPGDKPGRFLLTGTLPDGKALEQFSGEVNKGGDLELNAEKPADGRPSRITIGTVAKGKRLLVLYQRQDSGANTFRPMAEVGLTRQGSGFGKDQNEHECIITGGLGTISVSYKGQTYYVCCSGCKSTFLDNPEKELADYKKRKAEEKAQEKK